MTDDGSFIHCQDDVFGFVFLFLFLDWMWVKVQVRLVGGYGWMDGWMDGCCGEMKVRVCIATLRLFTRLPRLLVAYLLKKYYVTYLLAHLIKRAVLWCCSLSLAYATYWQVSLCFWRLLSKFLTPPSTVKNSSNWIANNLPSSTSTLYSFYRWI